jgi:hypothetical protein
MAGTRQQRDLASWTVNQADGEAGMEAGRRGGRRVRELPAAWPRRDREHDQPLRQRWLREPEPFEDAAGCERYPGATVLEDLTDSGDGGAALRILARYTVSRLLLLPAPARPDAALRTERRVALAHLGLLPKHDWERRALERLAGLCLEPPEPALVDCAIIAAECAARRNHQMGAFALYRAAFEVAVARHWWMEAARCAAGVLRLARLDEARVSTRRWEWRVRVLEQRAVALREELAAADAAGVAAGDG